MSFRLVPKSATLNDLELRNGRYFALFHRIRVIFGARCVKVVEDIPKLSTTEMQPRFSSFQRYITYDDMMQGSAPSGGLNTRGVAKYSDFGPIEGYISERSKIGGKLVLITNRKSYMSFRLVSKSVTLNDLVRRNGRYFALFQRIRVASGAHCVKVHVRYLIS